MRFTAEQAQNQLDWNFMEVEQDEWDRQMATWGAAAAANGFPVSATAAPTEAYVHVGSLDVKNTREVRIGLRVVLVSLAVLVLALLVGYAVWRTAQEGIVRMQGDIADLVTLESLRDRAKQPTLQLHGSVQAVEFVNDAAMATIMVSRTLLSGEVIAQQETRFYKQTPNGWQRTEPVAAFWGPTETLDTKSLHFVFGGKDRALVKRVAASAEALYATLRRATGQKLAANRLLTIKIAEGAVVPGRQFEGGRIQLTSPLLYGITLLSSEEAFSMVLRKALVEQMMNAALHGTAVKTQWLPMVQAFGSWLKFSDTIQPAPIDEWTQLARLRYDLGSQAPLSELLGTLLHYDSTLRSFTAITQLGDADQQEKRLTAAERLIDFIAGTYGIEALPKLLQGFGQYDDWETLAPAVLGISAAELEADWHSCGCGYGR